MIDSDLQDDLYETLVYDIVNLAVVSEGLAHEIAELAERHADRRVVRAIRIIAQPTESDKDPRVQAFSRYLKDIADRVDPDVNSITEVAS